MFKDDAVFNILKNSIYNDIYKKNQEGNITEENLDELDFTLRYLESTLNHKLRNITTESVIKCPFNTTEDKPFKKHVEIRE